MCMIWQVIVMNVQQRLIAIPTVLVLSGVAFTVAAATTRVIAVAAIRTIAVAPSLLGHFYICRTE